MKQPKKGRLWLNDGPCLRWRPKYRNHVWSCYFAHCRIDDGKVFRTLNILDQHSRDCLAIRVRRKLNSTDVIDALSDLFIMRGMPAVKSAIRRVLHQLEAQHYSSVFIRSLVCHDVDEVMDVVLGCRGHA